jgi:hypothetical protein
LDKNILAEIGKYVYLKEFQTEEVIFSHVSHLPFVPRKKFETETSIFPSENFEPKLRETSEMSTTSF